MFDDVVRRSVSVGSSRRYSVPVSVAVHGALVVALVIVPMTTTDVMPALPAVIVFADDLVPPPQPPLEVATFAARSSSAPAAAVDRPPEVAPDSKWQDREPGTFAAMTRLDVTGGELFSPTRLAPPATAPPRAVRVGGDIQPPRKIKDVRPVYPTIGQTARLQGTVILEATIDHQGNVKDTTVLRSGPLPAFDQSAPDAVSQWKYTPTRLNDIPVEVIVTVTVIFTLR
jgi:TonB family protein